MKINKVYHGNVLNFEKCSALFFKDQLRGIHTSDKLLDYSFLVFQM